MYVCMYVYKIETFDFLLTSPELATSLSFILNKIIYV